jgi:hypothetical protein
VYDLLHTSQEYGCSSARTWCLLTVS